MHHISPALPPSQARLARREARALAGAIDLLIVALIGALCAAAALTAMLLQVDPALRDPTPGEWAVGYAVFLLWLPAAALYASLSAARGQSVGARAVGLRIVADPPAAAARGLLWWPGALLFAVALWWPWIDPQGRAPVDRITGSWLIEASP